MTVPRLVRSGGTAVPLGERTDDELMTLSQAGVREAFELLVRRHAVRVIHACTRFVGDSGLGAELAQQTWVSIWVHRGRFRAEGRFVPWLVSAARNRCRNHLRASRAADRRATVDVPHDPPSDPGQIEALLAEERRRRVRAALARLPFRLREALLLRYAEELRYDEMEFVTHTSASTLRSRVHHGLIQLARLLEKDP